MQSLLQELSTQRHKTTFRCVVLLFLIGITIGYAAGNAVAYRFQGAMAQGRLKDWSPRQQRYAKAIASYRPTIQYERDRINDPKLLKRAARIFLNNIKVTAKYVYSGLILGISPSIHIFKNGFVDGVILKRYGWGTFFKEILPHGLLEVPLWLLSMSISISFAVSLIRARKGERVLTLKNAIKGITTLYLISIPLFFICATLETYGKILLWGK
jgi:uncharacterized membrane protein SpoIIM required for sporulation